MHSIFQNYFFILRLCLVLVLASPAFADTDCASTAKAESDRAANPVYSEALRLIASDLQTERARIQKTAGRLSFKEKMRQMTEAEKNATEMRKALDLEIHKRKSVVYLKAYKICTKRPPTLGADQVDIQLQNDPNQRMSLETDQPSKKVIRKAAGKIVLVRDR
jgi:hypothetical protein